MHQAEHPFWLRSSKGRVTPILQVQDGECGLACLAMVSATLEVAAPLHELRSRFRTSSRGSTLHQLMSYAEKIGLGSRAVRLEPHELSQLSLPAILHWDMRHYLVLEAVSPNGVVVCDPARGRRKLSKKEIDLSFTGIALELWRLVAPIGTSQKRGRSWVNLIGSVERTWATIVCLLALTSILEGLALLSPLLSQWLVDEATTSSSTELVLTMGVGFTLILLIQHSVSYLRSLIASHFGCDASLKRKSGFFRHLMTLPTSFFETRTVGDITSRFTSMEAIHQTLLSAVGTFVVDGLISMISLGILIAYNPRIALISMLSLAAMVALRVLTLPRLKEISTDQIDRSARAHSHFIESIRGARVIQMFGRQSDRSWAWHNLLVAQYNALYKSMRLRSNVGQACTLIAGIEGVVVLCSSANEVISGAWTLGAMMAFSSYRSTFSARISAVFEKVLELTMLRLHFDRLSDISETECDVAAMDNDGAAGFGMADGVRLSEVTFRYAHGEPTLLKGVSLTIRESECVALIGPSGSGKSTLVKLFLGLLDPTRGDVSVGGRSGSVLRALTKSGAIAAVMQDDTLFGGTIEENIHCFDAEPNLSLVQSCAIAARIHDDIMELPMAYMTLVGDMGSALSGGQRQRVVLARALYRQPKFLILDEATSHLDTGNEALISAAIRELKITRLVVAHRPETIASADRVIELKGGRLYEYEGVRGEPASVAPLAFAVY